MTREEAIEIVKKHGISADGTKFESALRVLIPELAESEDERIRRKMIEHFKAKTKETWCNMPVKDIIAYLEKQKENPKSADSISSNCVSDAKCEDRWHKVTDSLPDNGRLVLAKDCLGNVLLARYDGENWEVNVYDNEDHYCHNSISKWCEIPSEEQKEPKPAESISQLTVQGKGVYKICPRCKERMVRDDSMVYTSMPPQYRYECPKCGESECDTVMYDNPEMEEQKPEKNTAATINGEPIPTENYSVNIPLAEWSEEDEKQIRETLIQLVQDAWDGRLTDEVSDERVYDACMTYLEKRKEQKYIGLSKADKLFLQDVADVLGDNEYKDAAKRLRDLSESLYLQPKAEWNKEDEIMLKWIEDILLIADDDLNDKLNGKVSPITDSAYSSMKRCIAKCRSWLKSLPLKLKNKNEEWRHYIWAINMKFDYTALIKYDNTDNYEIVQAGNRPKQEKNGVYILIKDIKPQTHWKPSEEQMKALLNAEGFLRAGLQHDSAKTIAGLYEHLKKL